LVVLSASNAAEIQTAFATLVERRVGVLIIGANILYLRERVQFVTLAARHAIPTIFGAREFALAGGLMSYGSNRLDGFRQTGIYTARVLKGESPAELPVIQSSKFELVVNLKTAKAIGLDVPTSILLRADEVIE
jgi:putative tryptophan/tyrosine transport system substrate-binding protein